MGKLKKNKETTNTIKSEITKISKKVSLKPTKVIKEKKIKTENIKIISKEVKVNKTENRTPISNEQLQKAIEALLQYEDKNQYKDLFIRERPIFLQIDSIRIPKCPERKIRFPLKHTLLTEKQEICLIVPDLKKGRRIDHEPTIEHYEDLLRSKNVQSIKRIIPIRQLRVEYDQFELKRRLCGYYDYFLVAGNIAGHVLHLLGKTFIEKRKIPVPVKLDAPNLNSTFENALKKAVLSVHSKGATFIVQFGHSEMTIEQLADNLKAINDKLITDFPGGWSNIRSLHIKTDKSIALPIYYTLKSANKVNVPVIKPIRPKMYEKVTGEISTKFRNSEVTVHPGGRIQFKQSSTGISKNQLRKKNQASIKIKKAKKEKLAKNKLKNKNRNVKILSKPQTENEDIVVKNKKTKKSGKDNTSSEAKISIKSEVTKPESPKKKKRNKKSKQTKSPKTNTSKNKINKQKKLIKERNSSRC